MIVDHENYLGPSVLVIGKAKTGTTILSKVIKNSMPDCGYWMEPKDCSDFCDIEERNQHVSLVVKIIFEHWNSRPNLREAIIANELPITFEKKVLIVRDPRDELISRLLYMVKPLRDQNRLTQSAFSEWIELIERKEQDPGNISLQHMISELDSVFGVDFMGTFEKYLESFSSFFESKSRGVFAIRYEDVIDHRVDHLEEYLGFPLNFLVEDDEHIVRTRRSGTYGDWRSFFTEDDVEGMKPLLTKYMSLIGYGDWNLKHIDKLDSRKFSNYVRALAGQ